MIETLRRLYNRIDRLFDYRTLNQEIRFSRDLAESDQVTARQAFAVALEAAKELDRNPHLKLIVGHDVNQDGTAWKWEFFFDLPTAPGKTDLRMESVMGFNRR